MLYSSLWHSLSFPCLHYALPGNGFQHHLLLLLLSGSCLYWLATLAHLTRDGNSWPPGRLTAKLLQALTSTVILGSKSHGSHGHILLCDSSESIQTVSLYNVDTDHIENTTSNSSSTVAFLYLLLQSRESVAMEMCLQSRSLAAAVSSVSAIPAFSRHVTLLPP
jgi:hypothetical protein